MAVNGWRLLPWALPIWCGEWERGVGRLSPGDLWSALQDEEGVFLVGTESGGFMCWESPARSQVLEALAL